MIGNHPLKIIPYRPVMQNAARRFGYMDQCGLNLSCRTPNNEIWEAGESEKKRIQNCPKVHTEL